MQREPQITKEGQVIGQIKRISNNTILLTETVNELKARLTNVLSTKETGASAVAPEPQEVLCPCAQTLDAEAETIILSIRELKAILERLEL